MPGDVPAISMLPWVAPELPAPSGLVDSMLHPVTGFPSPPGWIGAGTPYPGRSPALRRRTGVGHVSAPVVYQRSGVYPLRCVSTHWLLLCRWASSCICRRGVLHLSLSSIHIGDSTEDLCTMPGGVTHVPISPLIPCLFRQGLPMGHLCRVGGLVPTWPGYIDLGRSVVSYRLCASL